MKKNFQIELDLPVQLLEVEPAELKKVFEKQILPTILAGFPEKTISAKDAKAAAPTPAKSKLDLSFTVTTTDGGGKGPGISVGGTITWHW